MHLYDEDRIIVLNTNEASKLNGTMNSSLVFQINGLLKEDSRIIHSHIQLVESQIPRSFYSINNNNNKLFYTLGGIFSIVIPVGNYNGYNIISTMMSLFTTNGHSIKASISRITGKITYTNTSNFTFNSSGSTILKILGFLPTINTTSVSNVLVSPFPVNLLGTKRLTIMSSNLATTALNLVSGYSQTQSILATVYVDDSPFGLISNSNTTNVNHLLKVKNINAIDLQILDEDGNFVDFNNQEITMKLKISSTYDIILDSKQTFQDITQQSMPPLQDAPVSIDYDPDTDLDTLLYNLKRPLQKENPAK